MLQYVLRIWLLWMFRTYSVHIVMNLIPTVLLHSDLNSDGEQSVSRRYVSTISLTWVTHVVKPNWCNLANSLYTCLTILSLGIWWRRLIQHIADTLQYILGGKIPHSPYTIILLVVAFTLRIELQKRKMTLSTVDVPFFCDPIYYIRSPGMFPNQTYIYGKFSQL